MTITAPLAEIGIILDGFSARPCVVDATDAMAFPEVTAILDDGGEIEDILLDFDGVKHTLPYGHDGGPEWQLREEWEAFLKANFAERMQECFDDAVRMGEVPHPDGWAGYRPVYAHPDSTLNHAQQGVAA
ncbi:MAG: hypothetical protein AAF311_16760 [Pseudomonadota bacterium]